jgi:hypothetical protein
MPSSSPSLDRLPQGLPGKLGFSTDSRLELQPLEPLATRLDDCFPTPVSARELLYHQKLDQIFQRWPILAAAYRKVKSV